MPAPCACRSLDDKPLLVEINLIEAQTHHALRNLAKAKASLTSARTAANAIYCPPLLQAQIDVMAGSLHAEEKDFKTAFSYFYESFENFDSIANPTAVDCLKYMLLCKIMLNGTDEVNALLNGKPGMRHAGPGLEAMRAVATAYKERSLHDFEAVLATHASELTADPIISSHLNTLYDMLLQASASRCPTRWLSHDVLPADVCTPDPPPGKYLPNHRAVLCCGGMLTPRAHLCASQAPRMLQARASPRRIDLGP